MKCYVRHSRLPLEELLRVESQAFEISASFPRIEIMAAGLSSKDELSIKRSRTNHESRLTSRGRRSPWSFWRLGFLSLRSRS